jgi:DNA-binding MarR family transcriptional regulator
VMTDCMRMSQSLEALLYGTQFRKLLEKELGAVQKEYGLCKIDIQILFYLYTAGRQNTSRDIGELNLFTKGHISQSLSRLHRKRLITMVHDDEDRRCVHNILTASAGRIIEKVNLAYMRVNTVVFADVTDEEKEILLSVAKKINHNIREEVICRMQEEQGGSADGI